MKISTLAYPDTHQFNHLFLDYCQAKDTLREFITFNPSLDSFPDAITARKKLPVNRNALVHALNRQYAACNTTPHKAVTDNIASLASENTFTVCTGHQLCLFTGPLYFIYKVITVIKLTEELNKLHPGSHFVPLYWMASEDHDFEEVNHLYLFGKKLEWKKEEGWQDMPVGEIPVSSLEAHFTELKTILGDSEQAKKLFNLLKDTYLKNKNLASATRALANALFGKYGLVVLDGNDSELKQMLKPVIRDDLFHHSGYTKVQESISKLEKAGYPIQVNPREINFFYFENGKRFRIEKEGEGFHLVGSGKKFSRKEMEMEIQNHPDLFSPNVVTRPLYQQLILPNIAYIGGPNELSYWLEYKSMFEHFHIHFPVLAPRNSVLLLDRNSSDKISKFNIHIKGLFGDTEQVVKTYISDRSGADIDLSPEEKELRAIYTKIAAKATKTDPTLQAQVEGELQKHIHFLNNLSARLIRAEKQKQEVAVGQIRKLKEKLFPGGNLQERHENFIPFYIQQGDSFLDMLKDSFQPLPASFSIIEL